MSRAKRRALRVFVGAVVVCLVTPVAFGLRYRQYWRARSALLPTPDEIMAEMEGKPPPPGALDSAETDRRLEQLLRAWVRDAVLLRATFSLAALAALVSGVWWFVCALAPQEPERLATRNAESEDG